MQTEGKRAAVFTASRRLGSSVARARARRRLREAYRRLRHLVPSHGLVMGFIARPAGAWMPFPELVGQMADALRHATRRAAS
jgi:ribonuclease P protein component